MFQLIHFCFFYFKEIFFGGLPTNFNIDQLNLPFNLPNKKFVGCLKHVYFNNFNILYDLNRNSKLAKYYSILPLELSCSETNSIPMTFYGKSFLTLTFNQTKLFSLEFKFKSFFSANNKLKIINGVLKNSKSMENKWSLLIRNEDVKLVVHLKIDSINGGSSDFMDWTLSNNNSFNITKWNRIMLIFKNDGFINMIVNELIVKGRFDSFVEFDSGHISIGSSDEKSKFIGCVKDVFLNENYFDPRSLDMNKQVSAYNKVTLNNCQLVNTCNRPNACEHDGRCVPSFDNGTYSCDCSNTGYSGKTCHFCESICFDFYLNLFLTFLR